MKSFYIGNGFYIKSGFIKRLYRTCCILGLYNGLKEFIFGHLGMYLHSCRLCDIKHDIIERFLRNEFPLESEEAGHVLKEVIVPQKLADKERIWFYWYQGIESMPEVVRVCYHYLKANNSNESREVLFLTRDNINEYVRLPYYLENALSEGRISMAHYSDVLRMALLYFHGGLWLDATVFVPRPIDSRCFSTKYWTHKTEIYNWFNVSRGRWSLSIRNASAPYEELFGKVLSGMLLYWKREKYIYDYMWMDYFLDIVYCDYPNIRKDIDAVPYNNPMTNEFFSYAKDVFVEKDYCQILESNNFFKLTYKHKLPKEISGRETVYGYIYRNAPSIS